MLQNTLHVFTARSRHRSFRQNRELKQQRRRRLRKRHLKSELALLQTQSRLIHLVQFVKCWQIILEFKSKGLYCSSRKEKESRCLVSTYESSEKCESGKFHVVVVQWRQRNVQELGVKYGQSCCFANLNLWKVWTQESFQSRLTLIVWVNVVLNTDRRPITSRRIWPIRSITRV